jgi:hypothetical protein
LKSVGAVAIILSIKYYLVNFDNTRVEVPHDIFVGMKAETILAFKIDTFPSAPALGYPVTNVYFQAIGTNGISIDDCNQIKRRLVVFWNEKGEACRAGEDDSGFEDRVCEVCWTSFPFDRKVYNNAGEFGYAGQFRAGRYLCTSCDTNIRESLIPYLLQRDKATPKWVNRNEIQAVYVECRRRSADSGIPHHVDHIIPLRGKGVSGLHVPWNLRVIPAVENLRKGNRLE